MVRCCVFLLLATVGHAALGAEDSGTFRQLYEQEWQWRLREFPTLASSVGVKDYDDRLGRVAQADQDRRYAYRKELLTALDKISCERLTRSECIDFRIFRRQVQQAVEDHENRAYLIPFNSDWGFYMALARLPEDTDFNGLDSYVNYLSRLKQLPVVMDEYIALMREGLRTSTAAMSPSAHNWWSCRRKAVFSRPSCMCPKTATQRLGTRWWSRRARPSWSRSFRLTAGC